jgi:hypothetical protein
VRRRYMDMNMDMSRRMILDYRSEGIRPSLLFLLRRWRLWLERGCGKKGRRAYRGDGK